MSGKPTAVAVGNEESKPIEAIVECWRIDDEWWRDPIARRYVEVVLESGKHLVLFEDLLSGTWYAQLP